MDNTTQELQKFLAPISEAQDLLYDAQALFKEHGSIRPIQCRRTIDQLEELNKYIEDFCAFLNRTERLPIIFTALRFRPLLTLHRMQALIATLIDCLEEHLLACTTLSEQVLLQRKGIYEGFETLLYYIAEMPQQIQFLGHEARFQEHRLLATLE